MKWFRHLSDLRYKPNVKRLIRKFGIEGYGLYVIIMESISHTLSETDPLPDLKESAEDLADEFKIDIRKVEEITKFCINEELLEYSQIYKKIISIQIAQLLDDYTGRKKQVVSMITNMHTEIKNSGVTPNTLRIKDVQTPNNVPPEENTPHNKKTHHKKTDEKALGEFVNVFLSEEEYTKCIANKGLSLTLKAIEKLSSYKQANDKKYISDYGALNSWVWKSLSEDTENDLHIDNKPLEFGSLL